MALGAPRTIYGVHSLALYDRADYKPFGIIKVVGSLSTALSGDFNDLYGGSNRYPFDTEAGVLDPSLTGVIKEVPNFAFEKFLGASTTAAAAESGGAVTTLTNKNGVTVLDATTGIASVGVKAGVEVDVKDGLYMVEAVGAVTVDVFAMSDNDFSKGTDKAYEDDLLKITATALTIATSTAEEVPGFGVELTGGSGTIAFVTGDTAFFYARKENSGSDVISIGSSTQEFPEFGAMITSQKKSNGDTFQVQAFRCKGIGLPIPMNEASWLEADVNIKMLLDSTEDKVMEIRAVKAA